VARLTTDQGEINLPASLPAEVTRLDVVEINGRRGRKVTGGAAGKSAPALPATLDIQVGVPGRIFVRGRGLDSEWRGRLTVTGSSDAPQIAGSLQAIRGTVDVLGKTFRVTHGEIRFDGAGGTAIDPVLDIAAEVVTADSHFVGASADQNADLFWALRGGGGNFGVVTSFAYHLHPVGPLVHLGLFFWGADQGAEALRFSRDFVATLPEDMGALIAGLSAPPAPFVPEQYRLAPGYALLVVGFGSADEHAQVVQPIRTTLPPLFELVTPIPYTQLQQMFDEGNPWGILGYEKVLSLDGLTDAAIAVVTEYLPRKRSPLSFVPIFVLGGAYGRVGEDETAFGGSRTARFLFNIAAICPTPELLEADRAWVRSFWEALRPHASGAGSYVNFMAEDEQDRVRASYGAAKYERLAQIKAAYDPDNVFHRNMNIKPELTSV
jgi:hypothetical protein